MIVTVSRKAHFNAAHRLFREDWSEGKNAEIFGKCSNPNYHGHNYELTVSVTGGIDQETGFVMDMKVLISVKRQLSYSQRLLERLKQLFGTDLLVCLKRKNLQ